MPNSTRNKRGYRSPSTVIECPPRAGKEAMMLDYVLKGGTVVDGTGAPARRADVGIKDGRVAEVGRIRESAARSLDVAGLTVTPGFVDVHTHYDAQVNWDPRLTPSSWHGVTTV